MDGFTYHNIFDTKGIEYIAIILFFLILIPFWYILNKQKKPALKFIKKVGNLTAGVLSIPQGLFFSKNHTWAHLDKSGLAKIGIDDLLLHMTGEVELSNLRSPGEIINKGDVMAEIHKKGKKLTLFSPVSGEIKRANSTLTETPGVLCADPYNRGWMFEIKPFKWKQETNTYLLADEATEWSSAELVRIKDFFASALVKYAADPSRIILQDGGALRDEPLAELSSEIWNDFQLNFLSDKV